MTRAAQAVAPHGYRSTGGPDVMLLHVALTAFVVLLLVFYRLYRSILNPSVEEVDLKRFPKKYEPATEVGVEVRCGLCSHVCCSARTASGRWHNKVGSQYYKIKTLPLTRILIGAVQTV